MSSIPPDPTKDEINELRLTVLDKLNGDGSINNLNKVDIVRFKEDDDWLRRFLMHHDNDQKLATEMALGTLKWRKEVNIECKVSRKLKFI